MKFFQALRKSVRARYSEDIDFKDYEARIQRLLDSYVTATGVEQITKPRNQPLKILRLECLAELAQSALPALGLAGAPVSKHQPSGCGTIMAFSRAMFNGTGIPGSRGVL